ALAFTSDAITALATGVLVTFLTAYFVIEAPHIWPRLLRWVPHEHRDRIAATIKPLESRLGGYVRGQILVSLAVGTFIGIGLKVLGVHHALILAVLAGLLNLVPFVGSLLTAVLAILVAFNQSLTLAICTVILYMVEQWFESNFIVPQLLGTQVELHPLVVLFSILIGASLMGLAGALIAVPIATATMYIAEEFYLKPLNANEHEHENKNEADQPAT
ncbi:MAG: AI-2E family transporter, partial [Cyanobacteria bacterium HKST-UBA01]|nr:AI-2E family transporter [Cyanobacteria bacterium HKST-UBA01]